jgi:hypothetical protein
MPIRPFAALPLLAALAAGPSASADDPKPTLPPKEKLRVFLLIGQSNMAGRGRPEAVDKTPHPRVLMLDKAGAWVPAAEPLHFDKPAVAGVGPGFAFGRAAAEALPDATIGLVPCAVGGSSIDQWKKGGSLRGEALRRAKIALRDGTLAGILWHQGESDALPERTAAYKEKALALFAELRRELDAPEVPVVVGTLGDFVRKGGAINEVLRALPKDLPRSACADAKGLADKGDKLHFSAEAARELGRRYFEEWHKLDKAAGR